MNFSFEVVRLGVAVLLGIWLCDIEPDTLYSWGSGIWHGMWIVPNFIRSWFGDVLCKADVYTVGYNVCFWIFSIISVLMWGLAALWTFAKKK